MTEKKSRKDSIETLMRLAEEGIEQSSRMTSWERGLEEEARQRGQSEMDKRLEELVPEDGKPKACPKCGKKSRVRRHAVKRTFQSLWGTHTIHRDYHYCEKCAEGFFPRDEFLGLPKEGPLTEELEARVADFAVNEVYESAAERWKIHYRLLPFSDNQFRQVTRRLGEQVEECHPVLMETAVKPPTMKRSNLLYVMADGGMVPMVRGQWREVKVGVFFRAEHHTPSSPSQRGLISEARYTAMVGTQEEFKEQMRAAWQVENALSAERIIWLSDGAPENWLLASSLCPQAVQILDWCHAVEAGMRCARLLFGDSDTCLPLWKQRIENALATDNVESLISELRECRQLTEVLKEQDSLDDLLRYYETNKHRMTYGTFRQNGWLIGSGAVESAHRHVIQTRMKKAGQHWSERGARQMAKLRAAYRTAGPKRFHTAIKWAYKTSVRAKPHIPEPHKPDLRKLKLRAA